MSATPRFHVYDINSNMPKRVQKTDSYGVKLGDCSTS